MAYRVPFGPSWAIWNSECSTAEEEAGAGGRSPGPGDRSCPAERKSAASHASCVPHDVPGCSEAGQLLGGADPAQPGAGEEMSRAPAARRRARPGQVPVAPFQVASMPTRRTGDAVVQVARSGAAPAFTSSAPADPGRGGPGGAAARCAWSARRRGARPPPLRVVAGLGGAPRPAQPGGPRPGLPRQAYQAAWRIARASASPTGLGLVTVRIARRAARRGQTGRHSMPISRAWSAGPPSPREARTVWIAASTAPRAAS